MGPAETKFVNWINKQKEARGLVDIKVSLPSDLSIGCIESLYEDLNEAIEAFEQGRCKKLTAKDLDGPRQEFWMADVVKGRPEQVQVLEPIIRDSRNFVKWCFGYDDYGNSNIQEVEIFETKREAWSAIIKKFNSAVSAAQARFDDVFHNAIEDGWAPLSKEQSMAWIDNLKKDDLVP